jgi:ABC-type multidrug transport system fused ATPase/permease subunit
MMVMGIIETHLTSARRRVRVCYVLVVGENLFDLLWPFAIGLAIDGLIDGSWVGVGVFVALSLAHTAVGFVRQRYQSRTFNPLYAGIAADLVEQQRGAGVDMASVSGRTELVGEYVEFLDVDIPLSITAGFAVMGSLVMLFIYDPQVGVVAAALAVPVTLLNRRLMAHSQGLYRELNDLAENEVDVIRRGQRAESRRHFGIVGRRWVRLSDAEAVSWGTVEILSVGLWVFTLTRATSGPVDVGVIIAMIAYVAFYTAGFDEVPGVLQRLTRLRDIRRRLDDPASTPPSESSP